MRDILFRGKRLDNGEWVEGDLMVGHNQEHTWINHRGRKYEYSVDPLTVGQFTGLADKNGEKIFEGDNVKYLSFKESGIGKVESRGTLNLYILWIEQETEYPSMNSDITYFQCPSELEVIGNIHDKEENI